MKKKLNVDELINFKYKELKEYQNKKYADIYLKKVTDTRKRLQKLSIKDNTYIESVVNSLYKTMAYKDEYEVGRLFTDGRFFKDLESNFKSFDKIYLHLSPPFLGLKDKVTKSPKKIKVTSKILLLFKILKNLKFIRNSVFDPFSYTYERKLERKLVKDYYKILDFLNKKLNKNNYYDAVQVIQSFSLVRGYGHVKLKNFRLFENELKKRLDIFKNSSQKKRSKIAAE